MKIDLPKISNLLWKLPGFIVISAILSVFFIKRGTAVSSEFENWLLLFASIMITGILIFAGKRVKTFFGKSNISILLLILIAVSAVYAPLIAKHEPGEILDAGECRLLPPFSSKVVLYKKADISSKMKPEIIVADSFSVEGKVKLFKKGKIEEIDGNILIQNGGKLLENKTFFLLGTDEFGRDLFSRVLYGARISLSIGISAAIFSFIIAALFAFISTFPHKILDLLSNRISEIFLGIPSLFVIIFAISFFGSNFFSLILVMGITSWMSLYKIMNGEIKRVINRNFIVSSFMLGISKNKIFINEIIPLILPSIVVNIVFQIANFIIVEASLSFLGLGPGNDYASWGGIIESGVSYLSSAWWLIFFPGVFLFITIVTLNKTGNQLEKYFNPAFK